MQQSSSAAGGSPCIGVGAGPGSAWAVTDLGVGSWGSGKEDDALACAGGPALMHPLCLGNERFRDS